MQNLGFLRYLKYKNLQDRITYLKWFRFIEESQWWGKERYNDFQWSKIKILLDYVYSYIPYYSELFKQMDCHPNDIRNWDDFRNLPVLTKEIVRSRINDFLPKGKSTGKIDEYKTGGSTGEPLIFYKEHKMSPIEYAFMHQQWKRVGYREGDSRMILRGDVLPDNRIFQQYDNANQWFFSSYHLTKEFISKYVDKLNDLKPKFFHVYPSSLYIMTQLLIGSGVKLEFAPKAILCGSEPILDFQRKLFETYYHTRVYSWLGLAEKTVLAGECETSNSLHIFPQYSYVELLDDNNNPISEPGKMGSIVGTSFNSFVTPLIRYRSSDYATYGGASCESCGRQFNLLEKLEGRSQNLLILKDGRRVPLFPIPFNIQLDAFNRIKKMQMIQDTIGELTIKLSKTDDFDEYDEKEIISKMLAAVNNKLIITVTYTDDFIRSSSGKHIYFIQHIQDHSGKESDFHIL